MHSKCGEIHYKEGSWHYLCVFCGLVAQSHSDFKSHLKKTHLKTTYVKSSKRKAKKPKLDDPLNWSPTKEEYAFNAFDSDTDNLQEVDIDISRVANTENVEDEMLGHVSDEYNLNCDVEADDENTSFINPDSVEMNKSAEEEDVEEEIQISPTHNEVSVETDSFSDNESQNETEIDWNTPYNPAYLKNREKRPYRPRKQPFSCTYCGRTYRRRYQFDAHVNMHTGAKPHQCDICGRQFRAIATLKNHLATHEKRCYVCGYCKKSFTRRSACLNHEKRHIHERKEPCELCGKMFYTKINLDTHKRRIHNKSSCELPFSCDLCPKQYRTYNMLSFHKNKIHYKFQCRKCEKKFVDLERLEEHNKIHVDENLLTM